MAKILIVDDDDSVRQSVAMILRYAKHETIEATDGRRGLTTLEQNPDVDVVLCDVKMPQMDGLECLEKMGEMRPGLPVIMISGHGTIETAVEATKLGAFDFIEKPLDQDRVLLVVRNAAERTSLSRQMVELRGGLLDRWKIYGNSPQMAEIRATIERIAPTDARVLVTGENGTGKELVARNLHGLSPRAGSTFVDVNCAAIPSELIESELFGHMKGAFTGAERDQAGRFEQADGGTLFLDEVGDMDASAQAKVLRVLETGEVQRLGAAAPMKVDVRVIAATNKDLDEEVTEGRFREDLLYRLNVIPIHLPPLRERREDLPLLLERFAIEVHERHSLDQRSFSTAAVDYMKNLPWPGNIRELRNFVERILLLAPGDEIEVEDVKRLGSRKPNASAGDDAIFTIETFEEFKAESERTYLQRKLEENGWNIKRTAETIGMQRSNLYKKIDRYNLK